MSNSALVNYKKISPNKTSKRNHKIDTITIHHMAGDMSVESCGDLFYNPARQASANYGIGSDGRIGLYVDEEDRAWTSGNADNDNRAVTIEVANDGGWESDWHVSDAALNSLIKLVADICKRNDIDKLLWENDPKLIGQVDKQNMTVHRWFQATLCPGGYLMDKMGYIADEVNKMLHPVLYKVQIGAFSIKENAERMLQKAYEAGFEDAFIVTNTFMGVSDSNYETSNTTNDIFKPSLTIGSKVRVIPGASDYTGNQLAKFVYESEYIVTEINDDRVVIATSEGVIIAAMHAKDVCLV